MAKATVMTPIGKMCFPALFEPKAAQQGGEPRYSLIIVFPEAGIKTERYVELRKAVQAAVAEKWGEAKSNDASFLRSLRTPFRNTSEKEYDGFDYGPIYISPWSKQKPDVVDVKNEKILVPGDVFAGQLVRATVRAFAYDSNGNKGVAFGLEHVQIVKADEPRLDGRRSAQQAFGNDDVSGELAALGVTLSKAPAGGDDLPW